MSERTGSVLVGAFIVGALIIASAGVLFFAGGGLGGDRAGLSHADHCREWPDRVGNVIRTVCERHPAGRDHHQDAEYALHGVEMLVLLGGRIRPDAADDDAAPDEATR